MASCTVQWPLTFLGTKLEVLSSLMDWSLFFVVVACFFVCLFFGKYKNNYNRTNLFI